MKKDFVSKGIMSKNHLDVNDVNTVDYGLQESMVHFELKIGRCHLFP